jgi:heat shock protein HslJ
MKNRVISTSNRRPLIRLAIFVALFCCTGILSCYVAKGPVDYKEALTANGWVLRQIDAKEVSMGDFENGAPYLKFNNNGKLKIFTGCDYIDGTFRTSGSLLWMTFDTSNRCNDYFISNFLINLRTTNTFKTKLERLILIRDKDEVMYFFPK